MNLQYTLERLALQLKNKSRTLKQVARVFQKIMKIVYETHFPNPEACRPGPNPNCPDADILTVAYLLEYIGEDSENSGYQRIKAELKTVFQSLPERSRFNRRRRNQKQQSPERFRKLQVRMRRRIEAIIGQLTDQFHISRVRALKHYGLLTRMSNKFGSCVLGAFVNQCLGCPFHKVSGYQKWNKGT